MRFSSILRGIALTLVILAFTLVLSTCGSGSHRVAPPDGSGGLPQHRVAPPFQAVISLDDALAELDALATPEGVDAALFAELKNALASQLESRLSSRDYVGGAGVSPANHLNHGRDARATSGVPCKFVSAPPTGEANRVDDLTLIDNGDDTYTLTWSYKNVGDYDQSGTVGISDITPLAMHFGEAADATNEWIDGDNNGSIDISDVTPIAMNFGVDCAGYSIRTSDVAEGPFTEILSAPLNAALGDDRKVFAVELPGGSSGYACVVPYDGAGSPGVGSNVVGPLTLTVGVPPYVFSVSPLEGGSGSLVTFSAVVTGTRPIAYAWDFGGGALPNGVLASAPRVRLRAAGQYEARLAVANAYGYDEYPFTLTVTPPPPGRPGNLVASDGEFIEHVLLQWEPTTTGGEPAQYLVYRAASPTAGRLLVATLPAAETSCEDAAPDYHLYWYWVSAQNFIGEGEAVGPESGYRDSDSLEWNTSVVESLYEIASYSQTSIAEVASRPAVAYYRNRDLEGKPVNRTVFAINDYPDATGEWSTTVFPSDVSGPVTVQGVIAGRPALASSGPSAPVTFAMNREPDGSGVWNIVLYEFPSSQGYGVSLAEVDGRPAISFASRGLQGPIFALNVYPDGTGSWRPFQVDCITEEGYNPSWPPSLAIIGGQPGLAYGVDTDAFVELRFAMSEEVDGTGRWNLYTVDDEGDMGQWYYSLAEVDGRPAISYYDVTQGYLKYAINALADGSGEWTIMEVDNSADAGQYSRLVVVDNRPAISYLGGSGYLRYSHAATVDGTGEWNVLELTPGIPVQGPSLAVVNDRPAISYYDTTGARSVNLIIRSE